MRLVIEASDFRRLSADTQKQLLKVTGDQDPRVLSYFQSVVTRKLRRILGDSEKKTYLIGWDYASTKWNKEHTSIIDGEYYVTNRTLGALQNYFRNA